MATKTIGATGRDYATFALHASYLDGLNTLSAAEIGEVYNDGEFTVAGNIVTYTGFVASSTNTVTIQPASGQGFKDHASAASNPLTYDQTKGVGLKCTSGYSQGVLVQVDHVKIKGLQIIYTSGSFGRAFDNGTGALNGVLLDGCIIEKAASTSGSIARLRSGTMQNCLLIQRQSGGGNGLEVDYAFTVTLLNNTIVRPTGLTASGSAITAVNGTTTVKNCAGFGFTNFVNNSSLYTGSNNASDVTIGFGSSNQASLTYADQFEDVANAGGVDFRAKSGATLLDNGTNTGTPSTDIIGQSISNTTRDIGAWEFQASGSTQTLTPSLFTNSQTFYAPTVTVGTVTLTPSLFTNNQTFYAPTVSSAVTLTPNLFTNTNTFHGPTVSQGFLLEPSLFTNSNTFYDPTVTVGSVTLSPSLVVNSNVFFGPTVSGGEVSTGGGAYVKKRKRAKTKEERGADWQRTLAQISRVKPEGVPDVIEPPADIPPEEVAPSTAPSLEPIDQQDAAELLVRYGLVEPTPTSIPQAVPNIAKMNQDAITALLLAA